jgi:hypothetical protein
MNQFSSPAPVGFWLRINGMGLMMLCSLQGLYVGRQVGFFCVVICILIMAWLHGLAHVFAGLIFGTIMQQLRSGVLVM